MPIYMNYNSIPGDVTRNGTFHLDRARLVQLGHGARHLDERRFGRPSVNSSAPSVSEVVVTKQNDVASGKLLVEAFTGEGETVQIDFCRTNKDKLDVYLTVTLTNTIIQRLLPGVRRRPPDGGPSR
ncbi:MAG: type VI secretion system tube protein Hcp [Aliidongia sp.]